MNTTATARDAVFSLGIVGVGNMGGATAANLLARGWPVRVNDLDASKTRNLESFWGCFQGQWGTTSYQK
jgi:prephenate dehydrogenase